MVDANQNTVQSSSSLSPEILRARAQRRRETAGRLWDEWLEKLLLEEAEELERDAAALELAAAIDAQQVSVANRTMQSDLAALQEDAKRR